MIHIHSTYGTWYFDDAATFPVLTKLRSRPHSKKRRILKKWAKRQWERDLSKGVHRTVKLLPFTGRPMSGKTHLLQYTDDLQSTTCPIPLVCALPKRLALKYIDCSILERCCK